jgi:D-glycero-alpha-D-manno-heptose-7-phosphate kinase
VIITRSPMRITLGGGGTDLASYYREHSGFVISAAIDKYVYIALHESFVDDVIIKYSHMERVRNIDDIQHPLIREALRLNGVQPAYLEIASMSDIPAGTGLGSSGSFTTALLHAIHTLQNKVMTKQALAEEACHIEIDVLQEPVGKQDQYISAYGGITAFYFHADDSVDARPLQLSPETLLNLEDNLILFFTGYSRSASSILKEQDVRTQDREPAMTDNLHFVKELGSRSLRALESGHLREFAELLHVHWEHKKQRSTSMSNSAIDEWYDLARANGALGGKVIGAGGGGFLMFYTEEKTRLRHVMQKVGLREVRLRFDLQGTTVVTRS